MMRNWKASEWSAVMRGPNAGHHRAAFEKWLRDPRNAAAYADYQDHWRFTDNFTRADMPVTDKTSTRPASLRWALGAAAVLALAGAWYLQTSPRVPTDDAVVSATLLADGSEVMLMDGARIEARFTAATRHITLIGGRARFTVAPAADRPFTVLAENSETTALGTIFEIDLRQVHPRVHLIEGTVEVRASGSANTVRLVPGESAEVEGEHARRVPVEADATATTTLDANALPLNAVLDKANRINAVPIRLADPSLGMLSVTGRFDISDSAALARKLAFAMDFELASGPDGHRLSTTQKKPGG